MKRFAEQTSTDTIRNEGRTSIQGKPCIVRPAERTAWTLECPGCFASHRSEQGAAPLAMPAASIPAYFAAGTICFQQTVPAAKSENPIPSARPSTENVGGHFSSHPKEVIHYGKAENRPRTESRARRQ